MPMPPAWTLGHQQSRYAYYPDSRVQEVAAAYRKHDLPLDGIHLDIAYMNGYRLFTWDPERFPDPSELIAKLRRQGVKLVAILDPGVKYQPGASIAQALGDHPELSPQDKSYYVYQQGAAHHYFMKRKDGRLYIGKVWPGEAVFVDYTIERAARWWGDLLRAYTDHGIAGIWTDMNEPSDFVDQTGDTQMDVVTDDGGQRSPYAGNRNLFALHMARATYEGLARLRPQERPYVITRAGYAGIQRYSTMWTGDNTASWESLALSVPMLASVGMSGEPFAGADVGGFANGRPDGELLTRWYQVGFLSPFLRNHAEMGVYDHEPWRFGVPYDDIIRKYLKLRYRLLPYLYTVLEEAHRTGVPVFRPLLLNYQDDCNTLNIDDEFMVGGDLLAAPLLKPDQTSRLVYLPKGAWWDYWTGDLLHGGRLIRAQAPLETLPLFVRSGAVLPLGPKQNWIGQKPLNPITFEIYPDESGQAATSLYEDDGISPAYEQGSFRRTAIQVNRDEVTVQRPEGNWIPAPREFVFRVHLAGGSIRTAQIADRGGSNRIAIR
jgi:alpha-glucosidase